MKYGMEHLLRWETLGSKGVRGIRAGVRFCQMAGGIHAYRINREDFP